MGLTARQHRALESIEERLRVREPRLVSMFSLFTRLTQHEAIPATEAVSIGRWRYLTGGLRIRRAARPTLARSIGMTLAPLVLIIGISAVLAVSGLGAPRGLCTAVAFHYSASKIDFPERNCPSRPSQTRHQQ